MPAVLGRNPARRQVLADNAWSRRTSRAAVVAPYECTARPLRNATLLKVHCCCQHCYSTRTVKFWLKVSDTWATISFSRGSHSPCSCRAGCGKQVRGVGTAGVPWNGTHECPRAAEQRPNTDPLASEPVRWQVCAALAMQQPLAPIPGSR